MSRTPTKWLAIVEMVGKDNLAAWRREGHGPAMIALKIASSTNFDLVVSEETVRRHMAEIEGWAS